MAGEAKTCALSIYALMAKNNAGRPGLKWRDTLHASRDTISSPERQATGDEISSTTVESALQIRLFMQNKPNFRKSQMNVNKVLTKDYEKKTLGEHGKNEPKTNPNEPKTNPNSKRPK